MKKYEKISLRLFIFAAVLVFTSGIAGIARAQTSYPPPVFPDPDCMAAAATLSSGAAPNPYANMYLMIGTVFDHPQIVYPAKVTYTKDNFLSWPDAQPCPGFPWKDEVLYPAAMEFINLVAPISPNPLGKVDLTNPLSIEQRKIQHEWNKATVPLSVMRELLMTQLQRRTACPNPANGSSANILTRIANATASIGSGVLSCFQKQQILCHSLKDPPSPPPGSPPGSCNPPAAGAGGAPPPPPSSPASAPKSNYSNCINHTGLSEVDGALKDCDTFGFSQEAHDAAWAHRCSDPNYLVLMAGDMDTETWEVEVPKCLKEGIDYDKSVRDTEESISNAILLLALIRK